MNSEQTHEHQFLDLGDQSSQMNRLSMMVEKAQTLIELKDLGKLCDEYDPYSLTPTNSQKALMDQYDLLDVVSDPFAFTNKVLLKITQCEQKLKFYGS